MLQFPVVFIYTLTNHTPLQYMGDQTIGKKAVSTTPDNPGAVQTVELLQRRWLTKNAFEIELTRPPSVAGPSPPGTFHGNAAGFIKKNLPPASYDFYLCGEREMTRQVTLLADEQFAGPYVFKEVFF